MRFLTSIIAIIILLTANAQTLCEKLPMAEDGILRYSVIEIIPDYLDEYLPFALEVGEISMKTEPGVLAMYPTVSKEDSCKVTILEIYSSQDAYKSHISSPHFQKYKQGTLHMVKSLQLLDQNPLNPNMYINSGIIHNEK
ncbi:antibiotic biosynthesis monooxygenase [Muribaculaceae bacterium Isolate-039 (Harlan)]|uniref:putative quinol monooxygenase n=2 Tax=Bacteroidia TaxID=200643 RepID=UPI000F496025|nr:MULTISPECIES: antibiotic biosynthesis monooxygenase family protein [Bacteroidales]ROS87039.1 antibiotic biosynthesis monooxygenase [Muribaculaceae bacterium Isolate-080 (Janvier)]ROS88129.1 antibiotic biosynthesis monooxygenase [Muribaculaceae bacterium Isolate-039 (Harlan)]